MSIQKKCFIIFFNIAMSKARRIGKISVFTSGGKFSVFTLSYVNTALNQSAFRIHKCYIIIKKYETFSVLIYSYINTSGNWKNEKLCGNTRNCVETRRRSVFTQFRVFPIFMSVDITVYQYGKNVLYFFYNIAQRTLTEEWQEIFHVDIELYQHGS